MEMKNNFSDKGTFLISNMSAISTLKVNLTFQNMYQRRSILFPQSLTKAKELNIIRQ